MKAAPRLSNRDGVKDAGGRLSNRDGVKGASGRAACGVNFEGQLHYLVSKPLFKPFVPVGTRRLDDNRGLGLQGPSTWKNGAYPNRSASDLRYPTVRVADLHERVTVSVT